MVCLLYLLLTLGYLSVGLFIASAAIYTGEADDTELSALLIILFYPLYIAYRIIKGLLK